MPGSRPPTSTGSSAATWTTCAATTSPTASASATSRTSARTVRVARRRARWSARPSRAILSGQATTVLVFRSLNGRSGVRFGQSPVDGARVGGAGTYDELFDPYGLLTPGSDLRPDGPAPHARVRHEPEHLGGIALACRARANANPLAQMHERTLTMDDYLAGADDLRAAAAVRLLPRDRRRLRRGRHVAPSGPADLAPAAGADPRRRPGLDPGSAARASSSRC